MRVSKLTMNDIKGEIMLLVGQDISMEVNKGRKKIENYNGVITNIYPSVFTVDVYNANVASLTYSYSEVLCGNVKIKKVN